MRGHTSDPVPEMATHSLSQHSCPGRRCLMVPTSYRQRKACPTLLRGRRFFSLAGTHPALGSFTAWKPHSLPRQRWG